MSEEIKDPNTIELSVHETVGVSELHPGGKTVPKPTTQEVSVNDTVGLSEQTPGSPKDTKPAGMSREDIIKYVLERKVFLSEHFVAPHHKKSRRVTNEDLLRVIEDAKVLHEICLVGRGDYNAAFAMAHPQIDDQDPLRFFITQEGQFYINPVIINHTKHLNDKKEGCMSNPSDPMKTVMRFHKITVRYQTIAYKEKNGQVVSEPFLTPEVTAEYGSRESEILQHEMQHLNGSNIYFENASALDCVGE